MSYGYSYPNLSIDVITEYPYSDVLGNYPFFVVTEITDPTDGSTNSLDVLIVLKVVTCIGSTWTSKQTIYYLEGSGS